MKRDYQFQVKNGKLDNCNFSQKNLQNLIPPKSDGTFYLLCLNSEQYKELNKLNSLMDKLAELQNQIEEQPTFGYDIVLQRHQQKLVEFVKQKLNKKE